MTAAPATNLTACDRARMVRQMGVLDVLAQVGSVIAALIGQAWRGREAGEGGLAGCLAFLSLIRLQDRVGRAVRLAISLRLRLQERLAGAAPASPPRPKSPADIKEIDWAKELDREFARDMREDLEGLEGYGRSEFSKAYLDRPAEDLIASICHDLGLDPGWVGLTGGEVDAAEIELAASAAVERLVRRSQGKRARAKPGARAHLEPGPTTPLPPPAAASP